MKTNNHDILATSDYVQNKPLLLSSFHAPSSIYNTENATKTYRWVLEQFMAYNITDGMVLSLDDEGGSVNDTRIFPVFDSARGVGAGEGWGRWGKWSSHGHQGHETYFACPSGTINLSN